MPNRQTQDQQQPGSRNPGTFSPDDDEAQQDEVTTAADQNENFERESGTRSAQQTPAAEDLEDDADGDDIDDEDEDDSEIEDGSGGHV